MEGGGTRIHVNTAGVPSLDSQIDNVNRMAGSLTGLRTENRQSIHEISDSSALNCESFAAIMNS